MSLQPLAPEDAVEMYLSQRRGEVSDATLEGHKYRLRQFLAWCEENDVDNLNDVTGRDLQQFRTDRRERDGIGLVTLRGQLSTLRVFLDFCASVDAVPEGLREKVLIPTLPHGEGRSETSMDPERGEAILDWLDKYHYASRKHVLFSLFWRTGMRGGSIRALDLCDFEPGERALMVRHRPTTDTPLKNKERGERDVALTPSLTRMLEDYIEGPRVDVEDDYGRHPLLTTREGRPHSTTLRASVYRHTRPCKRPGEECPHDRDPAECVATVADHASKCPSVRSPHDLRSGAITAHLLDDVPVEIVSERMDVSMDVLDAHYDRRSKREKMEQRRHYLNNGGDR